MALNLTGLDIDLYFTVGTAINCLLLFGIVLPSLTLIVVCVIAILLAKELCGQMKALLINIFAGEVCNWLSGMAYNIMFIIVAQAGSRVAMLCSTSLSLYFVATLQISSGTSLYAIMVYIFIKYGVAKVKWWVIISYIAVFGVVALAAGTLPFIPTYGLLINEAGFCAALEDSVLNRSISAVAVLLGFVHLVLIITFTALSHFYIKKNTMEGSVDVKKSVAKTLKYLMVSAIISFVATVPPSLPINIRTTPAGNVNVIYLLAFQFFIPQVLLYAFSTITPIVTIILLKPAREAMRDACRRFVVVQGAINAVHPA